MFDHARRGSSHGGARGMSTDPQARLAPDGRSGARRPAPRPTRICPPILARRGTTREATERRRLDASKSFGTLRQLQSEVRSGRRRLSRGRGRLVFTALRAALWLVTDLTTAVCSITATQRRRFFWAAWWTGAPCHAPFRRPDAANGGARSAQ